VTAAMLDDFYRTLQQDGVDLDRETYDEASDWVARRLAYQISVAKFNRQEGWKRLMADDPGVRAATELLRAAGSTADAFSLLPDYAEARGLTLGSAWQAQRQSRVRTP
jgi:ATP-dependent protease HslVU (ClpYQ) peptidase subunit